jgi:UDP-glucuronate 4-epimerase
MRILITGAAGFIGFHLARHLLQEELVLGLDNFNSYYDPALKLKRAGILEKAGVQILKGDIQDQKLLSELLNDYRITHVAHLAAQAGVRHSLQHPEEYLASNINGFFSLLEALKGHPEIKTIFASSSSVYGLNQKTPFSLEDPTDHPANLYGASKKTGELFAQVYHHLYGLNLIGLRFFTVYGPWGRPDMAYFKFARLIDEGRPIELFNHGKMERDFTYIDDIVLGIVSALKAPIKFGLFNLGGSRPEPLLKLVEYLEENLQKKAVCRFLPMPKGEVLKTYADIQKSTALLGFQPKTSLKEGLRNFALWYQQDFKAFLKTRGRASIKSEAIKE